MTLLEAKVNKAVDKFILFVRKHNLALQILLGVLMGLDYATIDFINSNNSIWTMDFVINFFVPTWGIRVPATSGYFDPVWGFVGATVFLVGPIVLFTFEGIVLAFSNYRTRGAFFLSFIVCIIIFSATWDMLYTHYVFSYWSPALRTDSVDWLPPVANLGYYIGFSTSPTFKIAFTWEAGVVFIGARYGAAIVLLGYIIKKEREARRRRINELRITNY